MRDTKQSFVIYRSWANYIYSLPDDIAVQIAKAICAHETEHPYTITDEQARIYFDSVVKPELDRNDQRYKERVENARASARKRIANAKSESQSQKANRNQSQARESEDVSVSESVSVSVSDKDIRGKRTKLVPPSVDEVRAYCKERNNDVDPEAFVNFYASKGWMIGKNRMKDWKAAVRTWEKNRKGPPLRNQFNEHQQQNYDIDDLERRLLDG